MDGFILPISIVFAVPRTLNRLTQTHKQLSRLAKTACHRQIMFIAYELSGVHLDQALIGIVDAAPPISLQSGSYLHWRGAGTMAIMATMNRDR